MPKKCESCRFYRNFKSQPFEKGICSSPDVFSSKVLTARQECDKEGDGRFVYYEPKPPAAGMTFEPPPIAMAAHAGGPR